VRVGMCVFECVIGKLSFAGGCLVGGGGRVEIQATKVFVYFV